MKKTWPVQDAKARFMFQLSLTRSASGTLRSRTAVLLPVSEAEPKSVARLKSLLLGPGRVVTSPLRHEGSRRRVPGPACDRTCSTRTSFELRKPKPSRRVAWVQNVPEEALHLSAVTIGEIEVRSTASQDIQRGFCDTIFRRLATDAPSH